VSDASREEIECIEQSQAIREEDEGDDDAPCVPGTGEKARASTEEDQPAVADVTSSDKHEQPAEQDSVSNSQDAKETEAAGVSVGD